MAGFESILGCLRSDGPEDAGTVADNDNEADEELSEKDVKEVEDIVEDFMAMQNKDMLRRDLKRMATENVMLRRKVARLEVRSKAAPKAELSFQIDVTGEEEEDSANNSTIYDPVGLNTSILGTTLPSEPEPTTERVSKNSCFNCNGNHNLSECPEPRDPRRIAQNRKAHQNSAANSSRFFEEGKREGIVPGLPSPALRNALGLRKDEVPEYIYRLRELGYPPGWLRHAEIRESGLGIYTQGGERIQEGQSKEVHYDTRKLIAWPGFNTDLPRQFRDEGHRFNVKPQSRCVSLKEMKKELTKKEQKAYKRGKMQDLSTDNMNVTSMEIEEGECDSTLELTDSQEEDTQPPGEEEEGEIISFKKKTEKTPEKNSNGDVIQQPIGTGVIASTDTGTPIVEMYSPFEAIPETDKWGVNMSEHVAFENLPNYTGTWDKMTGLIKKIRNRKEEEEDEVEEV